MQHDTVILLVVDDAIDNDEGLCIGVDGVEAIHQHHASDAWCAATCNSMHLCAKVFLYFFIYAYRIRILESLSAVDRVDIGTR